MTEEPYIKEQNFEDLDGHDRFLLHCRTCDTTFWFTKPCPVYLLTAISEAFGERHQHKEED